jgi:trk system potassium uptake protein TrkH
MNASSLVARLRLHLRKINPARTIMVSFALMILVGALLLNLPAASRDGQSIGFINALFTATSANCVTGLVVVNTLAHWTFFGQIVILLLIQLGGLGFMTVLTLFLLLFRRQISLKNRLTIQASFNLDRIGGMVRLVKHVVAVTLIAESVGALLLAFSFYAAAPIPWYQALWQGVFHSISAFCNAGFDVLGPDSLVPYVGNPSINFIIMTLITAGGIGFPVWIELLDLVKNRKHRPLRLRIIHLSLHTKIALSVTGILVVAGTLFFALLEWRNPETLGPLSVFTKLQASLFQSVTLRTAGFNTISQAGMTETSRFISCIFMILGGSPAGTAGGIKTVTLGIIFFAMLSVLRGRAHVEGFGRRLPLDLLQKALSVVCTMLIVIFTSTVILHFSEQGSAFPHTLIDLLFESCSAAGTVGVTTGLTPYLSLVGKLVVTVCMFLGRLSPVTVVVALNMRLRANADGLSRPDERVIIG